jgi:hypothetical protein
VPIEVHGPSPSPSVCNLPFSPPRLDRTHGHNPPPRPPHTHAHLHQAETVQVALVPEEVAGVASWTVTDVGRWAVDVVGLPPADAGLIPFSGADLLPYASRAQGALVEGLCQAGVPQASAALISAAVSAGRWRAGERQALAPAVRGGGGLAAGPGSGGALAGAVAEDAVDLGPPSSVLDPKV